MKENNNADRDRFGLVMDELNSAVFEWDFKEHSFYCSEAYKNYAISRISPEEILKNQGPADIVYEDDYDTLQQFFRDTDAGKDKATAILRLKMMDGTYRWCRLVALFYRNEDGSPSKTIGIILDINEEQEQNFMFGNLVNGLPGGVAIFKYDKLPKCQYFSDGFAALSGRTREELDRLMVDGTFFRTVISASDYERFMDKIRECVGKGEPINMTYRYRLVNEEIGWVHLSATKLREEEGHPVYYCVFTKPTEEAALYRDIVEESTTGIFVGGRQNREILFINERLGELFQVPSVRIKKRIDHADTLPDEFAVLSHEEILSLKEKEYTEFHVTWKGKLHLQILAKALNWNGIDSYIMYFNDETAVYEQQLQLQRLVDHVPAGIGIYEICDGKILQSYVNNAFYDMLGMTRESRSQYNGSGVVDAIYPEDRPIAVAHIQRLIDGEDKVMVYYRLCNGKGEWQWFNLTASVIERRDNYLKFYGAFQDCDKMMRAQLELQEKSALLDAALSSSQVMTWNYDYKNKIVNNSGSFGTFYHMPKRITNIPDVFFNKGMIHEESEEDLKWLFANAGDGKRIQRDICCKSEDGSRYQWKRVVYTPIFDNDGKQIEAIGTAADITEEKIREKKYEEQLLLSKVTAQKALAVAYYNLTKNYVTDAKSDRLEFVKEMTHSSVDEVLKQIRDDTINQEEKERFAKAYDCRTLLDAFEQGITHMEIRHHIQGDNRWMQTNFDMIKNPYTNEVEATATLQDIQTSVRAEMVVNRLLAVDYEAIMTIDVKTGLVNTLRREHVNEVMQDLFAMLEEQDDVQPGIEKFYQKYAISESYDRAIIENDPEYISRVLETEPLCENMVTLCYQGEVLHKRIMYAYLDDNKDTILCAIQDVSEAYRKEKEQSSKLKKALQEAEQANKSKTEFLSRMSHDMRTPMNGILGIAELSVQEQSPVVLRENMSKIMESGNYLLNLINDTLDFQKIESGKLTLHPRAILPSSVFNNVLNMIRPAIEEKEIDFQVMKNNADMDSYIRVDPVRVTQIVFNLLSNAVKFTQRGGQIGLEIWNLSRDHGISSNCIKVRDTGIGMSREYIENELYQPFSQEHNLVSEQYAGSGLGLSIVYNLVGMMGGRMEVESEEGTGTTFTLYIDFEQVPEEEAREVEKEQYNKKFVLTEELLDKKILLVEDHPLNATIATKMLEKAGCKVIWVDNGQKGVDTFASSEVGLYDAILMDIRMPVMNGLEAAETIRSLEREDAKSVPIIAMTANAYEEDVQKSLAAGMNAHLSKPISPQHLYETLAEFIQASRQTENRQTNGTLANIELLQKMIHQEPVGRGAFSVEQTVFNNVYQFMQRNNERLQHDTQMLLFTMQPNPAVFRQEESNVENDRKSLENAVRYMLRCGDLMMNFSAQQIVVLLVNCNEENASLVASRILEEYKRRAGQVATKVFYEKGSVK